jgi:hemolysin activation/secretion protein
VSSGAYISAARLRIGAAWLVLGLALLPWRAAWAEGARPLSSSDPAQVVAPPPADTPPSEPIEVPKAQPQASEDHTPRFVLVDVVFEGAKAVPASVLAHAWDGMKGKSVSINDLTQIGLRAEAIYADRGFPFVAVVVTPQQVNDGRVHFRVVEGRISDLKVLGGDAIARRQAAAQFGPLINRQPLSTAALEGAYVRAKAVPGLAIAGSLRKGQVTGGMDLVLQARRRDWSTYANINNLYPDTVGPWGVLVGAVHAGGSRYGDETAVQAYRSVGGGAQTVVRASHDRTIDAGGTKVSLMALGGWANPAGEVAQLNLATKVYAGRVAVSRPLISRLGGTLQATAALDINNQTTKVFSTVGLTDDRLRIFSYALAGELNSQAGGRLGLQVEVRKGLDILGATGPADALNSRLGANPQAIVARLSAEAETPTFKRLKLVGRLEGQFANSPLTAPEQFQIGDLTLGRGYQPGAAVGDEIIGGSTELRAGPYRALRNITLQPYLFADAVRAWVLTPGAPATRALSSYGGGVRIEVRGRMSVDLAYAKATTPPLGLGEPTPSGRVLCNITVGLNDAFSAIHRRLKPAKKAS